MAMVAGTISRVVFGLMSDRFFRGDRVAPLALLALIGAISTMSLFFLGDNSPLWCLFVISALLGVALIGWNSLAITLVAEIAGNERVGSVMGILFTIAWGGMVIAPPIFGSIADSMGYAYAWFMVAILSFISFIGFAIVWRQQRETVHT